jgi:hypothetical protein
LKITRRQHWDFALPEVGAHQIEGGQAYGAEFGSFFASSNHALPNSVTQVASRKIKSLQATVNKPMKRKSFILLTNGNDILGAIQPGLASTPFLPTTCSCTLHRTKLFFAFEGGYSAILPLSTNEHIVIGIHVPTFDDIPSQHNPSDSVKIERP